MTLITDILDYEALQDEIRAGYVTERYHPEFPELAILNYTDRCQFDNHWNRVTKNTRGLIYNRDTLEVIARGLPKFYNYGDETNTGPLDPDMQVLGAYNKWDGSLGIFYPLPDGRVAIATRGSFASEQAIHATAQVASWKHRDDGFTDLYEIIYPENRIVLDYGDRDELMPLGSVDIETGAFYPFSAHPDDITGRTSLRNVLALPPRPNAEGWVVWLNGHTAVKIKQADYVELHRIVSNLSVKEVWRQLRAGTFDEFAVALPDEFHQWARDTAASLEDQFWPIMAAANDDLSELRLQAFPDRKAQALWVQAHVAPERRGFVFSMLDGKDIVDGVWRMVEPKGAQPMRYLEEAA